MKVCLNGCDHINEIAVMSIFGKDLTKPFLSITQWTVKLKLGIRSLGLIFYQVRSNATKFQKFRNCKQTPWCRYLFMKYLLEA